MVVAAPLNMCEAFILPSSVADGVRCGAGEFGWARRGRYGDLVAQRHLPTAPRGGDQCLADLEIGSAPSTVVGGDGVAAHHADEFVEQRCAPHRPAGQWHIDARHVTVDRQSGGGDPQIRAFATRDDQTEERLVRPADQQFLLPAGSPHTRFIASSALGPSAVRRRCLATP